MQPGWHPDPDDENARRYWDGEAWSAPLPKAAPASSAPRCSFGKCSVSPARGFDRCYRHMTRYQRVAVMRSNDGAMRSEASEIWMHSGAPAPDDDSASAPRLNTSAGADALVCPHCGVRGRVFSKEIKVKKGISGAKATGAVITVGWSMLATGLSRKETVTEMHCSNCGTTWRV